MKKIFIFTDGGARGNPGPAATGVVIKNEKGKILTQFGKKIGETTNNVAEYMAVIEALNWLIEKKKFFNFPTLPAGRQYPIFNFLLDSRLVVNQLNGLFKVKKTAIRELVVKIRELEASLGGKIFYFFIPREQNYLADKLANEALDLAS